MQFIKAPDFPTGGIIYGYEGVKSAFETGRGRVIMRSKYNIEPYGNDRERIIVTEIPYQVNKADMIKKTADLVNDRKLDGISNIYDESDKSGMRIVYELKKGAISNIVMNNLFKQTQLQTSFSINNIALVKGKPQLLNLKNLITNFVDHRHDVVIRRTTYELKQGQMGQSNAIDLAIKKGFPPNVINNAKTLSETLVQRAKTVKVRQSPNRKRSENQNEEKN